jgi:hypothetical protein
MGNNPVKMIDPDGGFAFGGGDPPEIIRWDPNFTIFAQYEARGTYLATGSVAFGIAANTSGDYAIYTTVSLGVGYGVGASTGWTSGIATSDNMGEFSGLSINVGALATASYYAGITGSIEVNIPIAFGDKDEFDVNFGVTYSIPKPTIGIWGEQSAIYADLSYTYIIAQGNFIDDVTSLKDIFISKFGIEPFGLNEMTDWLDTTIRENSPILLNLPAAVVTPN